MRVLLSLFVLISACVAQSPQKPKETPEQELERVIGRDPTKPIPDSVKLKECQDSLRQWQDWSKVNVPICKQYESDNTALVAKNQELEEGIIDKNREFRLQIFSGFSGIGFGVFLAFMAVRAIRRWWPISKQRRQLITLLLIATWVTVVALVMANNPSAVHHPINLAVMVFVYSLPALAFGGVGVWWFGRTKPEILW